jgi:uncharacterized protein (TIGR03067 family)
MRRLPLASVSVVLLSTIACSRPHAPEVSAAAATSNLPKQDLDNLQGTWRIESSFWNGVEDPEIAKTVTILFQDDQFIVVDRDGNRQQERIQLLPDQNPKAIDCWSKGGGSRANPGIYLLEGDTFKWCSAGGGNKVRPTSFESKPGSKQSLIVMRRE